MLVRRRTAPSLLLAVVCALGQAAAADDAWPGLWGPRGDGSAGPEARLPRGALRVREAWRRPIGSGFSGVAVSGGRGYTALTDGPSDHAIAFDPESGRELWRARLGETYRGHDGTKDGPASTPAVDDGRVFIVSRLGVLFALDGVTGKPHWQRDLRAELGAAEPFYGFATSPKGAGRHVVVQTGGEKHGLAGFDKATGATAWTASHSKTVGYASPVQATLGGIAQVVVLANDLLYGVRPEDGGLLWSLPTGPGEEAMRPPLALPGDRVLISGTNESKLIQLRKDGDRLVAAIAWKTARLKNSLSATVVHEGHLYGFNSAYLVCLDLESGDVAWRERVYAGSLILVDGHLLILGAESGELRVARASPQRYEERFKGPVFNAGATSVSSPAFARGRLYMRNVEEMVAFELKERGP